jgi:hypothetical protein
MTWIRSNEGVSDNLIPDIDHEANGSGRLVVVGSGAAPTCGGVGGSSPELCGSTALKLNFQWGFLLWHRDDVANSFCSPWDNSERRLWLAMAVSPLRA